MAEHQHLVIVIDERDEIIEKIDVTSQNFTQASKVKKELKKKYKGQKVQIRDGYLGVSKELFDQTKALLEKINQEHPEMFAEVFDKERPEFRHLGYNLRKKKHGTDL